MEISSAKRIQSLNISDLESFNVEYFKQCYTIPCKNLINISISRYHVKFFDYILQHLLKQYLFECFDKVTLVESNQKDDWVKFPLTKSQLY